MPIIIDTSRTLYADVSHRMASKLPGCLPFLMEERLRDAAKEFLELSRAWRARNLALLTTVANQNTYTLTVLPTQSQLVDVFSAFLGEEEIDVGEPGSEDDFANASSSDTWTIAPAPPDQVQLTPAPQTAGQAVTGTLILTVSEASTGMPTRIYELFGTRILDGAIARCMEDVNKPWSNPQMAVFLRDRFLEEVDKASNMAGPVVRQSLRVRTY